MSHRPATFFAVAIALAACLFVVFQPGLGHPARAQAAGAPSSDHYEFKLGSGDKLKIGVFGEDTLTGEFTVSDSGTVSFPLIGEVQAKGLSPTEFQHAVETKLKDGYLKDPRVSVEVETFRPYFILGEVTKPGQYPYVNELTVLKAVATAEGFTYRADVHKVFIQHANEKKEHAEKLTDSLVVQPGDIIRVPERFF